jgi:hypothetical protein
MTDNTTARRRRVAVPAVIAGAASALVLAFSMTPTFAALTAGIQNTIDTAGSGTLLMEEYDSTSTLQCSSGLSMTAVACATVNKYGGNLALVPGAAGTPVTISIKNAGTLPATAFSLAGGACTQSNNGPVNGTANDLCGKINIVIKSGATSIWSGTATSFASQNLNLVTALGNTPVASGATVPFTFTVSLDASAGNAYEGLKITQPMTWTFGA